MRFNEPVDRYQDVYNFIVRYKRENDGNSPTRRVICAVVGVSSMSLVGYYLCGLEGQGKITLHENGRIHVVGGQWQVMA